MWHLCEKDDAISGLVAVSTFLEVILVLHKTFLHGLMAGICREVGLWLLHGEN